jgi:hypothetical protein
MTPEEIAKKEVAEFIENLDMSFARLKATSNVDLKSSFKDLFIHQGKTPEQAERMAEIAVSRKSTGTDVKSAFKAFYLGEGKTPEVAERMAEIATQGR